MEEKEATSEKEVSIWKTFQRMFSTRKKKKPLVGEFFVTDATPTYPKDEGNGFEQVMIVNSAHDIITKSSLRIPSTLDNDKDEDNLYYKINDGREKIAVIFNHRKFKPREGGTPARRHGTEVDCDRINGCLKDKLGFKNPQIYKDPERRKIMQVINEVSLKTSSEVSCIVVVVMTHGNVKGILEAYDCMYPKSMLFDPFTKETSKLGGVPKLFIIQACRGTEMDEGVEMDGGGEQDVAERLPRYADLLMLYSTVENFVSWRELDGTWLIQELCNQLDKVPCKWNALDLMTFVLGSVARGYESNSYVAGDAKSLRSHKKRQMPQLESTLTKLLNF